MFVIYCILNKISNKIYIGKSKNHKCRWNSHISVANSIKKGNTKKVHAIHFAINKYGKDNFLFEIIDSANSDEEILILEKYWIKLLKQAGMRLYNETSGGESSTCLLGEDNSSSKLKNYQVLEIKFLLSFGKSQNRIADQFNISRSLISRISTNKEWTHLNLSSEDSMYFNTKYNSFSINLKDKFINEKFEYLSSKCKGRIPPNKGKKCCVETIKKKSGENSHFSKLNNENINNINLMLKQKKSIKDIAKKYNVSISTIYKIKNKQTWKL